MLKGSRLRGTKVPRPRKVVHRPQNPANASTSFSEQKKNRLPPLHARLPEARGGPSPQLVYSYEEDMQRLEDLVTKNYSARLGLLKVQTRIMELSTQTALREGSPASSPAPSSPLKLPLLV